MRFLLLLPLYLLSVVIAFAQPSVVSTDRLGRGFADPFIEGGYGVGKNSHKGFDGTFAPGGILELRIGYTDVAQRKKVLDVEERFVYGGVSSTDYSLISPESGEVESEMIRFGVGARNGFGWNLAFMDLIPYGGYSFDLSKTTFTQTGPISGADSAFLGRVGGDYRFGQSFEAGMQLRVFPFLGVNLAAHGQIAFPRLIFPEWVVSYLTVASGLVIISEFSEDIVNSSTVFGPIMYFVLRNGFAYGFFAAMKNQQHWPFSSESPLAVESFKISALIVF
jgi:hypothetical protein